VARDASSGHLETDELSLEAAGGDGGDRFFADEHRLALFDDPPEPRLERVRRLVDVVPVEGEARLETQRVACPEAGG